MEKSKMRRGWTVGVNAPGYMPDMEVYTLPSHDAAFMALQEELVHTRESLYDDSDTHNADAQLQDACDTLCLLRKSNGRVTMSVEAFGLVHWICPAE
jgi:hypothetical protein